MGADVLGPRRFVVDPGPATLGVPVPGLRYPGLLVEVDAMAVIRGLPLERGTWWGFVIYHCPRW